MWDKPVACSRYRSLWMDPAQHKVAWMAIFDFLSKNVCLRCCKGQGGSRSIFIKIRNAISQHLPTIPLNMCKLLTYMLRPFPAMNDAPCSFSRPCFGTNEHFPVAINMEQVHLQNHRCTAFQYFVRLRLCCDLFFTCYF